MRRFPRSATSSAGSFARRSTRKPCGVSNSPSPWPVRPNGLSIESGLDDFAAIDVAVIEELAFRFAAQAKTVGAAAKFLAKRADETSVGIIYDDGLAPHGR